MEMPSQNKEQKKQVAVGDTLVVETKNSTYKLLRTEDGYEITDASRSKYVGKKIKNGDLQFMNGLMFARFVGEGDKERDFISSRILSTTTEAAGDEPYPVKRHKEEKPSDEQMIAWGYRKMSNGGWIHDPEAKQTPKSKEE